METQAAMAEPLEGGGMRVTAGSQSLDAVQLAVAQVGGAGRYCWCVTQRAATCVVLHRKNLSTVCCIQSRPSALDSACPAAPAGWQVLQLPHHQVTAITGRVGGAFGGKASRAPPVAALAAVAAHASGRPVSLVFPRDVDLATTCGRSAAELLYDVGYEPDGTINAIDMKVGCGGSASGGVCLDGRTHISEIHGCIRHTRDLMYLQRMRMAALGKLASCALPSAATAAAAVLPQAPDLLPPHSPRLGSRAAHSWTWAGAMCWAWPRAWT